MKADKRNPEKKLMVYKLHNTELTNAIETISRIACLTTALI
jgi:hypothetical protein